MVELLLSCVLSVAGAVGDWESGVGLDGSVNVHCDTVELGSGVVSLSCATGSLLVVDGAEPEFEDKAGVSVSSALVVLVSAVPELVVWLLESVEVVNWEPDVEESDGSGTAVELEAVEESTTGSGIELPVELLDEPIELIGSVLKDELVEDVDVLSLRANAFTGCIPAPSNNPPIVNATAT
jgi:hypothetical protein